jgi:lipid-binding SYLF domain-containing protein
MNKLFLSLSLVVVAVTLTACSTAPKTYAEKEELEKQARDTVERFKRVDPQIHQTFFETAEGYAVFPSVGKGAAGIGGAFGRGVLFEDGRIVGYCTLTQGTVGLQLGGQAYSEIIFFRNDAALYDFKQGNLEFSAQASAVAASADASTNANYEDGVAVFTLAGTGLMYEASIGGQGFDYEPKQ